MFNLENNERVGKEFRNKVEDLNHERVNIFEGVDRWKHTWGKDVRDWTAVKTLTVITRKLAKERCNRMAVTSINRI